MPIIEDAKIIGFYIRSETICRDCVTDEEEKESIELSDVILEDENRTVWAVWAFCDRCKQQMSNHEKKNIHQTHKKRIDSFSKIPAFIPLRIELIELLKYWYRRDLQLTLYWYADGHSEHKEHTCCVARREYILYLLSKDETEKVLQEIREEFQNENGSCFDEQEWNVFFYGSEKEQNDLWIKYIKIHESQYEHGDE